MPYSIDADGKLVTPGGCRIDNGRCFSAIGLDLICRVIRLQFTDGTLVDLDAGAQGWVYYDFVNRPDPGCVWNAMVRQAREQTGSLPRSPGRPFLFADLTASPPDYIPRLTERDDPNDYLYPCPGET